MPKYTGESKCGMCLIEVKDSEKGVACDGCRKWHHNSCAEIDEDLYKVLAKFEGSKGQGLNWYCPTCNTSITNVLRQMQGLLDKQEELEKEINNVKKGTEAFGSK